MGPIVRIVDAGAGGAAGDAPVRLVVSGIEELDALARAWRSSGAVVERAGNRLEAISGIASLLSAAGRGLPGPAAAAVERSIRETVAAWTQTAPPLVLPEGELDSSRGPLLMGVVNVTPDSFSDGGLLYPAAHPDAAVQHARDLWNEGAHVIDVGGESTRPGASGVDAHEELRRVLPVVEALAGAGATVSIDTTKPEVADAALGAGAAIVNDISGGRDDDLLKVVAQAGAGYVLMHSRGTPADMQSRTDYDDVVAEVYEFLAAGIHRCGEAGIAGERILVDPGIGFAKTAEQNLALLRATRQFRGLGRPVLVGASRKSFVGRILGGAPEEDRLEGSLAAAALVVADGAAMVRVHDVGPTRKAVGVAWAIAGAGGP